MLAEKKAMFFFTSDGINVLTISECFKSFERKWLKRRTAEYVNIKFIANYKWTYSFELSSKEVNIPNSMNQMFLPPLQRIAMH